MRRAWLALMFVGVVSAAVVSVAAQGGGRATPAAGDVAMRVDYLTFAQGAVPISIGGAGSTRGADFEAAIRIADGDVTAFSIVSGATADVDTEFVYQLPALTTFDRLAVPNVVETPSPTVTFSRLVEVHGSTISATDGFALLASATLQTHSARGLVTELTMATKRPVRWVKIRLVGGINVMQPTSSFEFSEIIGNGTQEAAPLALDFHGAWRAGANRLKLTQRGPLVAGCYDTQGDLTGTVTGNVLRATGLDRSDKTPSAFILSIGANGTVRGVRSTNGGPFRLYTLATAPAGTNVECTTPSPPALGCGSIIHGITFDFDSAVLRPESAAVLSELFAGLKADASTRILIEGHTSSEGTEAYNLRLSEQRAQAVVADLVRRGLTSARLAAAGIGEARPIATNADESGRSLNRRVEVKCR